MKVWEVILDALQETAMILPFLFIVYYLIELFEFKFAKKIQNNKILKGKYSPLFGSVVGCVPQCGFSVVSADLYTKRAISVGALIAVFIATSDEAFPLMISNFHSAKWLILLIAIKVVFAIAVGYLSIALYKIFFKKQTNYLNEKQNAENNHEHTHNEHKHGEPAKNKQVQLSEINNEQSITIKTKQDNLHKEHDHEEDESLSAHGGCCHHHVETKSFDWLHPLLHCLKISAFVLTINIIFGIITKIWIGEGALASFLSKSLYIQPLLAVTIGFIPNCASSVVLTELFILNANGMGGLSFGALVAGLSVNAGLGVIILLKQNRNVKENIFILLMLTIPSLIIGYALNFI